MVVDDHEMVRLGLKTALELEDDFCVVAEADSGEQALAMFEGSSVDVVLMDVMMDGLGGIAACRQLREMPQPPRVLMLTSSSNEEAVMSSLVAGASGYLLKNVAREELLRAIRAVHAGRTTLDPKVAEAGKRQLEAIARGKPFASGSGQAGEEGQLSEREVEVVALIAQGMTNKEIAESLIIAEKTARNHVSRILTKLGLTRRSQAAAWAVKTGLSDGD